MAERRGCSGAVGRFFGRFLVDQQSVEGLGMMDLSMDEKEAFAKARMPQVGRVADQQGLNRPEGPPGGRHMEGDMPVDRE